MLGGASKMTNESTNMELFDRWTDTEDKEEYVKLGMQLFPEATEEEMRKLADEALAGYYQA